MALSDAYAIRRQPHLDSPVTIAGDYIQLALPLSALAYSMFISDWQGVGQLAYATTSTVIATEILKRTIDEERPYQDENASGRSFPSGHTSFAFAGAGYWQMRYGWYVGAPMYAAAAFVGYSRNFSHMHNWTDIAAGAALGIGFNILFTSRYIPDGTNISVSPTDGGAMLRFNTVF